MKKNTIFWRILFYALGIIILSVGITLNTKSNLGVSPIISIPFAIANILNLNLAMITFLIYIAFVIIQFILKRENKEYKDLLQIPFSILFSVLMDIFGNIFVINYDVLWKNLLVLFSAIVITGIGAAIIVNMKLVPNPADGLAQAIAQRFNKDMGFGKNILDISCVSISVLICIFTSNEIVAVGLGTLIAMIGVGRIIALFNLIFKNKMQKMAGI